jgi:ribosomal protein L11 methylase PrmA|uniref:hypothetical protein n=1 Tax=[Lactobacillus] rogosae TaxID=706562 RepID=UPI00402A9D2B
MNENFTGRELREFITDNKIKIAMSEKQSDMIVEQIHQEGFGLCIKDNNLYLTSYDQEGFHESLITTDALIDLACKTNYKKLVDAKQRLDSSISSISEYCKNLQDVCVLTNKEQQMDAAYVQTDKAIALQKCINSYSDVKSKIR